MLAPGQVADAQRHVGLGIGPDFKASDYIIVY